MIEGLTPGQTQALTRINVGASALSFAGSFFIALCYVFFKDLRSFPFKLVFYLSLSDMFCSLFNLLGNPGEGLLCYAQGYSTQFFSVASFLWTTTIAFTLHRTVVKHKVDVEGFGLYFHGYVWGKLLISLISSPPKIMLLKFSMSFLSSLSFLVWFFSIFSPSFSCPFFLISFSLMFC
jgi:hypothetical protein